MRPMGWKFNKVLYCLTLWSMCRVPEESKHWREPLIFRHFLSECLIIGSQNYLKGVVRFSSVALINTFNMVITLRSDAYKDWRYSDSPIHMLLASFMDLDRLFLIGGYILSPGVYALQINDLIETLPRYHPNYDELWCIIVTLSSFYRGWWQTFRGIRVPYMATMEVACSTFNYWCLYSNMNEKWLLYSHIPVLMYASLYNLYTWF
jgi:hypothetical protein